MYPVYLFDFDGTLINSLRITLDAFRHAIHEVTGRTVTDEEVMHFFGGGELHILQTMLGSEDGTRAYSVYRDYVLNNASRIPLHDGVSSLLEELTRRGARLGIVTGRGRESLDQLLRHHHLTTVFATTVAYDDVGRSKPDPAGLILALQHLRAPPTDAMYVGDSWVDVLAARAAGLHAYGARWDRLADFKRLAPDQPPRQWLSHPQEILHLRRD